MHQVQSGKNRKKIVKYSQPSLPPGEQRLLVNKTLNIYADHQYAAINCIIFSMLISCANEVWCMYIMTHHYQVNFTFWHKVLLPLLIPCPQVLLGTVLLQALSLRRSFNGAKNNKLQVKLAASPLMFHLSNCNLFHEKNHTYCSFGTAMHKYLSQC